MFRSTEVDMSRLIAIAFGAIFLTATNDVIATFTLTWGAPGRVVKCL